MNCPNCGQKMEAGYLAAGGYMIKWTPNARSFSGRSGDQEVQIQKLRFAGKNDAAAHLCRFCQKIVVDYELL